MTIFRPSRHDDLDGLRRAEVFDFIQKWQEVMLNVVAIEKVLPDGDSGHMAELAKHLRQHEPLGMVPICVAHIRYLQTGSQCICQL